MFLFFLISFAYAQIEGRWITEDKSGVIEISKVGDVYEGRVVGGEKKGDGLDAKNPDPSLRSRELMGLVILKNLKKDGDEFTGGEVYDPNSGNTYKARARLLANGSLKLRGYIGISLFGRNEIWSRHKP